MYLMDNKNHAGILPYYVLHLTPPPPAHMKYCTCCSLTLCSQKDVDDEYKAA